jgi:hypothetical protein
MKVVRVTILLPLILLISVLSAEQDANYSNWNGLLLERSDPTKHDEDFFNRDNEIYLPGREFVFSYRLMKGGKSFYCRTSERGDVKTKTWSLVKTSAADKLTIKYIGFRVLPGYGGLTQLFPDYGQTVIQQLYYSSNKTLLQEGLTGLVENPKNVWVHPFRAKVFSVTEMSPFPYVKRPLKVGQQWSWRLDDIDDRWSDPRLVEYHGKVTSTYEYAVRGYRMLHTRLGKLNCIVIDASAKSRVGYARLRSYFHPTFGFVRLEYDNVDKSKLTIELVSLTRPQSSSINDRQPHNASKNVLEGQSIVR